MTGPRVLFVVSDRGWSGRARAFLLAANGLAKKGYDVTVACEADCPVQLDAARGELKVVPTAFSTSMTGNAWQLRRELHGMDVVFVHSDAELLMASSALRLGGGGGAVIQRVPPFGVVGRGGGARVATRIAPTGLLFSTDEDMKTAPAVNHRIPSAVAPLAIDTSRHESARESVRATFGLPADGRLIVCVYDGAAKRRLLSVLRTVKLLSPRHSDLHVAVMGVPALEEMRVQAAALGITNMVTFIGAHEDEISVMRSGDIGWVAADGDAAAFAALDFMAFGIAVLAERSVLTEHYVADGIAGVLLSQADASTTAAAVAAFLARSEQRRAMGSAGRARLQREFSYDAMIRGYEQAITRVMERAPHAVA